MIRLKSAIFCVVAWLCFSHHVIGDEPSTWAKSVNSATSRTIALVGHEDFQIPISVKHSLF